MSTLTGKVLADFTTSLASALAVGATSATLQSATDDDGVALVSGTYYFTLDGSNSSKEHIRCSLSSTALTSIYSISRQGVATSGTARAHRLGATVTLTDFAHILVINNLINGTTDLDSSVPLKYDGTATISDSKNLATKKYVDDTAIAGAPDSSTTVKGIVKMSVAPASATSPIAVGDNDTRVPTSGQASALVGNNTDVAVGTGNKYVTQTGLQHNAEKYAADTSGSSTAYVITLSPAPTSYTTGMVVYAKIVNANTTTTPTLNVNSLGAKTIVKDVNTALAVGDIIANQFCIFIYDGTNFVLKKSSPQVDIQTFTSNGTWTKPGSAIAVKVQAWGGGGGGGGVGSGGAGAGGGGGGSYVEWTFNASDLSSTETIVVGTGGAGSTGSGSGTAGGNSTVGTTKLIAYGGGSGALGNGGSGGGAGGGGGNVAVGGNGSGTNGGTGGGQSGGAAGAASVFGGGGGGGSSTTGGLSTYGGGGGGGGSTGGDNGKSGGNSYFGGAGGAGGSSVTIFSPTSVRGGNGGANGGDNSNGGNGTIPGGGGAGGYSTSGIKNGGAGADGKVIITTFF